MILDHIKPNFRYYHLTIIISLIIALWLTSGCQRQKTICPPDGVNTTPSDQSSIALEHNEDSEDSKEWIEIGRKLVNFDKVVRGDFCQDSWEGMVYVSCEAQVAEWIDKPTFLDGCSLSIADDTVVYVADHNNEAYYQGCSCHYSNE